MASSKDTFEAHTFRANSFACGTWRGVAATPATVLGMEWTLPDNRLHFEVPDNPFGFELPDNRMHYELVEED